MASLLLELVMADGEAAGIAVAKDQAVMDIGAPATTRSGV